MMIEIPALFTADEAATMRSRLAGGAWIDGAGTAGHVAARAKANQQLSDDDPLARELMAEVVQRLSAHPRFIAAALPLKLFPPRFNRYGPGETYGRHIDSAIFAAPDGGERIRSDLSATLFLSDPGDYDGGELSTDLGLDRTGVKLSAGHLLLYPASSLHEVRPVTRGVRYAAFFWVQSLIREQTRRSMLLQLDDSIQALGQRHPDDPEIVTLTGLYHNLLREWSET